MDAPADVKEEVPYPDMPIFFLSRASFSLSDFCSYALAIGMSSLLKL